MTMHTSQIGGTESTHIPLGAKLQSAREAQRIERKDAAAQLRLNESVIDMMESDSFPESMPQIFIRGYIRAYGKLLQMPDEMISAGLEPIKPRVSTQEAKLAMPVTQMEPLQNRAHLMKGITTAVVLTLLWLTAVWWNNRAATPTVDSIATSPAADSAAINTDTQAGINITPASAMSAPTIAPVTNPTISANMLQPNANPAAGPLPAGISIQAATTQAPQASVVTNTPTVPNTVTASVTPIAPPSATSAPNSIPAYKRAAQATIAAHQPEANGNFSD